jgi:hypothetical protein
MRIVVILATVVSCMSCVSTLSTSRGLYALNPATVDFQSTEKHTVRTDEVRYSPGDVGYALKRAVRMEGATIDVEGEGFFSGFAGVPSPEATCTAQVSFAAYWSKVDDHPTTKLVLVTDHQGFCVGWGNTRNDEFAQATMSSLYTLLSTYD